MAIFHLSAKVSKHAKAKHDYICRENQYANQSDKKRLSWSVNLPAFSNNDSAVFWSACDAHERKNANKLREYVVALPLELTSIEQKKLLDDFVKLLTTSFFEKPLPCTIAVHEGKSTNPHAHIVLCERATSDTLSAKDFFSRKNPKAQALGGSDRKLTLEAIREEWSNAVNKRLSYENRVSHLSLKAQNIERKPTRHVGPAERGELSKRQRERAKENKAIKTANAVEEASLKEHKIELDYVLRHKPKPKRKPKRPKTLVKNEDIKREIKRTVNVIEQNAYDELNYERKLLERAQKPNLLHYLFSFLLIETETLRKYREQAEATAAAQAIYDDAKNLQNNAKKELFDECKERVISEKKKELNDFSFHANSYNKSLAMNRAYSAKIRSLEEKIELVTEFNNDKKISIVQEQEQDQEQDQEQELST